MWRASLCRKLFVIMHELREPTFNPDPRPLCRNRDSSILVFTLHFYSFVHWLTAECIIMYRLLTYVNIFSHIAVCKRCPIYLLSDNDVSLNNSHLSLHTIVSMCSLYTASISTVIQTLPIKTIWLKQFLFPKKTDKTCLWRPPPPADRVRVHAAMCLLITRFPFSCNALWTVRGNHCLSAAEEHGDSKK